MSPLISILEADPDATDHLSPFAGGEAIVRILQAHHKTGPNEDAALAIAIDEEQGVLAVADGAGGHAGAAEAASIAVRTIRDVVTSAAHAMAEVRGAILRAIDEANRAILETRTGAMCTLAIAEIEGAVVQPYHVGDAQILIVGQRAKVRHQSVAHSPVGYAVHAGLIDEPEAIRHDDRHLISNAVGMEDMRIEIGPLITLAPRDTVLVASDGVYDNLYLREIVDAIRTGPIDVASSRLLEATRARMTEPHADHPSKPDDIGIAIYRPRAHRT